MMLFSPSQIREHAICLRRFLLSKMGKLPARSEADARLALILQTPAIDTEPLGEEQAPSAPIGIHILAQDAQLHLALWMLKSFYHFAGVRYPLTVHLQGENTRRMRSIFRLHFPQARLITQAAADSQVESWLLDHGLRRLLAMRRKFFLMMKLIDLSLLARTPLVLFFDTDVLFFRHPQELLTPPADWSAAPHLFMRDDYLSYCITPDQAHTDLGVELVPFANTGVMRLVTDAIDLEACERYMVHPALARQHWHLEQTLHALNASAHGRLDLLPATYGMLQGLENQSELIARHYVTPVRPFLAEEGIAHLLKTGFLDAVHAAR